MQKGVIDIGSNTIKAFVYDIDGKSITSVESKRCYTHLYSYVVDGKINDEGINALCRDVNVCNDFLHSNGCTDIYCFATAALRDSENKEEALNAVLTQCNISVDLISGEIEALCDICSMKYVFGVKTALGMDMGGGSAQIFNYNESNIDFCISLPLGALKIKELFVKNKFPNCNENNDIERYVKETLSKVKPISAKRIYAMGGSIVELAKIFNLSDSVITVDMLLDLKCFLEKMPNLDEHLKSVATGREYTVMPAITALLAVAKYFDATEFFVIENGVREGYLYRKIFE